MLVMILDKDLVSELQDSFLFHKTSLFFAGFLLAPFPVHANYYYALV